MTKRKKMQFQVHDDPGEVEKTKRKENKRRKRRKKEKESKRILVEDTRCLERQEH